MEAIGSKDERMWAMFVHLSAFAGHFFPFGHIIGPVVIWAVKKDEYPLVNDQGKESINCQLTMTIYFAVAIILCFVLIGIPLLFAVWLFDLVVVILAAVKANDGVAYRYPFIIRFL